jgi:Glycosyl hydrolases family 16
MIEDRQPEFGDGFETGRLDPARWLAAYLPQWSSRRRSAPTAAVDEGRLVLTIVPGQGPWCPEWDGDVRVSSIQTGCFAGPLGSPIGQHRFAPGVVVREPQPELRLYTPRRGRIELRAAAEVPPDTMAALWMIGFEDHPDDSGEICVMEVFGRDVSRGRAAVGMGVHPHHDPRLREDFERVELAIDPAEPHDYAIEWTAEGIAWEVDGRVVRRIDQSPDYPMQLMLGVYAFRAIAAGERPPRFVVDRVRGFAPVVGRVAA